MNHDFEELATSAPEGLADLRADAPANTLDRFKRRASMLDEARFVLGRQIYGFWIVLNTLLKLLFKHVNVPMAAPDKEQASRYRRAVQNSKEG